MDSDIIEYGNDDPVWDYIKDLNNNTMYPNPLEDYLKDLRTQDFGIVCIHYIRGKYKITDKHKWLLAKIAHGF